MVANFSSQFIAKISDQKLLVANFNDQFVAKFGDKLVANFNNQRFSRKFVTQLITNQVSGEAFYNQLLVAKFSC